MISNIQGAIASSLETNDIKIRAWAVETAHHTLVSEVIEGTLLGVASDIYNWVTRGVPEESREADYTVGLAPSAQDAINAFVNLLDGFSK